MVTFAILLSAYGGDDDNDYPYELYDEYYEDLSPSARYYTFPANAVQSFGTGTEYWVDVTQANLKIMNKIGFFPFHILGTDYGMKNGALDIESAMLRGRALTFRLLTK